MLILIGGAKGGLGTTTLAQYLCRYAGAVPLDAADGRLAAETGAPVLDLSAVPQWTPDRRSRAAEHVIRTRQPLLWTPACRVWEAPVVAFAREVAAVAHVVADGGIAPPAALADLATLILIVSADDPVAHWHEQRLKAQWPQARAVIGDLKAAAQALAAQTLGIPTRQSLLDKARASLTHRSTQDVRGRS